LCQLKKLNVKIKAGVGFSDIEILAMHIQFKVVHSNEEASLDAQPTIIYAIDSRKAFFDTLL
jgi:hypothetical protein